jgi:predicted exporter
VNPPKTASSSGTTWAARTADAYVAFVTRHAKSVVLFFAALTLGSGLLAARLPLRTEFSWLLPDDQPSVIALHKLTQRRPSTAVIEVGIASAEPAATERFAKALAERLRTALPSDLLREVDEDDSLVRRFIWQNRHLYASLADLQRAHEALAARIEKEQAAHHPLLIDFEDKPPSSADNRPLDDLLARMKDAQQRAEGKAGYVGEGGRLRMLVVRFRFGDTEPEKGRIALRILDQTVAALAPAQFHPSLTVGYAGDPVTAALEHDLILGDMVTTTLLCLALVLGLLFVALRSFRSVVILGITLSVGCVLTFGFTWLVIGHLNSSTAFLGSVVAGNGINFGIIHLSRYLEERRRGLSHPVALRLALSRTLVGTLVASTAAATAYASLMITSFRGFSEFGIIAGSGMVFCWLASYSFLPALLHWLETARPLRLALSPNSQDRPASPPAFFSRPGLRAALPVGTWLFLLLTSILSLSELAAQPIAAAHRARAVESSPRRGLWPGSVGGLLHWHRSHRSSPRTAASDRRGRAWRTAGPAHLWQGRCAAQFSARQPGRTATEAAAAGENSRADCQDRAAPGRQRGRCQAAGRFASTACRFAASPHRAGSAAARAGSLHGSRWSDGTARVHSPSPRLSSGQLQKHPARRDPVALAARIRGPEASASDLWSRDHHH